VDVAGRALERARRLDPAAEAAFVRTHLRAGGRDPRHDPQPEDVVDAPGPGQRVRAYPGSIRAWGSKRREAGSGPMCRLKGRKVVALWPKVTVAEVEARPNPVYVASDRHAERIVIPVGTRVGRGTFYSEVTGETSMRAYLPSHERDPEPWKEVLVRGRVEVVIPPDRRDGYEVEWVQVLYPEVADAAAVADALRTLESRLSPEDLEDLRAKVERAPGVTADLSAVRYGSSHTEHVSAWRRWAKGGTVRRLGREVHHGA
jgi:hypothetical protein